MRFGVGILLVMILLMILPTSAYQYTYMNNLSLTDAKNDVINYKLDSPNFYTTKYNKSSFEFPELDIQSINFKIDQNNITATMNFAAAPILNATITYYYFVEFYLNSTTSLTLEIITSHTEQNPGNLTTATLAVVNPKTIHSDIFTYISTIRTQVSKNSVYWQIDLSPLLNLPLNLKELFVPNNLVNHFTSKYQYKPKFDTSVESDYSFQGTGIKGQLSSYMKDTCSSEAVLTVNPYKVVAPIIGILASIFIIVGLLIRYRRPKIKYDLG